MNTDLLTRLKKAEPVHREEPAAWTIKWQSPSNIALVKYWGKREGQLPANPSFSMTLNRSVTRTSALFSWDGPVRGVVSVNGDPHHLFLPKLRHLLSWLVGEVPALGELSIKVTTDNTFPHSTGIASSASGLSAFALCLLEAAVRRTGLECSRDEFFRTASRIARMGSGSACRSVYGGFTVWGETAVVPGSSDEYAVPVTPDMPQEMRSLHDAILVLSGEPKVLPSTLGHRAMEGHPFAAARRAQAGRNLEEMLRAMAAGDLDQVAAIAENEALTLHALIMTSQPGAILMKPATLEAIRRVQEARQQGTPAFFTLDAGANLHLLYPAAAADAVHALIAGQLQPLCENGQVIFDRCGDGPAASDPSSPQA